MTTTPLPEEDGPAQNAVMDALLYGCGVMVMQHEPPNGVVIRHVPIEQYREVAEAMMWAHKEYAKGELKQ